MIINDLDGYYIVFDTKNWNTELDTLLFKSKRSLFMHFPNTCFQRWKTEKLEFPDYINPLFSPWIVDFAL